MTRYADDLKKIVGIDKLTKLINDQIEKDRINAKRGIGYGLVDGAIAGATAAAGSGLAPSNALGSNQSGDTKALTDAALEALSGQLGGGSGGTDSGSGTSDSTGGGTDGTGGVNSDQGAIIGGEDGVYDAAVLAAGGGPRIGDGRRVLGISGLYDPTTGRWVTVREDGYYRAPDDRLTPDEDGTPFGFYLGVRWTLTGGVPGIYQSVGTALEGDQEYRQALYDGTFGPGEVLYSITVVRGPRDVDGVLDPGQYRGKASFRDGTTSEFNVLVVPENCVPGSSSSCPLTATPVYNWPRGKPLQLGKNSAGQFIANARDTDIPTLYKAGSDILTFEYNDSQYITQKPTADGGFMIGESDSSGNYTQSVYLFNAAGQKTSVTPFNYADQFLP